jgi:hypothetical protein
MTQVRAGFSLPAIHVAFESQTGENPSARRPLPPLRQSSWSQNVHFGDVDQIRLTWTNTNRIYTNFNTGITPMGAPVW